MKFSDEEIIAYLNGELDDSSRKAVAAWIESSADAKNRVAEFQTLEQAFTDAHIYEHSPELLSSFRDRISEERVNANNPHLWFLVLYLGLYKFVGGFGAGKISTDSTRMNTEFGTLKNEVQALQRMVMINTLKDHTASERLQVINMIDDSPVEINGELVGMLIRTMNNDESPNVRMAAVQALGNFTGLAGVREQLVRSLGEQDEPLVQIALINVLTEAGEKTAIAPIRSIASNEALPVEVRRTAEIALDILI